MIAINLGSGRDYRKGWINIDNKQMYHGDFEVDVDVDIFDYHWSGEKVDFILLNHVAQYITPDKMEILLKRWHSWLKDGGSLYIEAGNILKVCQNILEAKTIEDLHGKNAIMQLYGVDDNIWNKWAWCPASLTKLMSEVGFNHLFTGEGYFHRNRGRDFLTVGYKGECNPPPIPELII